MGICYRAQYWEKIERMSVDVSESTKMELELESEGLQESSDVKLEVIIKEVVEKEGCILYDIEFTGSGGARTLRVYIDKDSGIGIDECTQVSRSLNALLDASEELVPGGAYNLEVSSPGLERPLKKKWHFEKVVGERIDFRLSQPIGSLGVEEKRWQNCKHTEGILASVDEDRLTVELSGSLQVQVPFNLIEKAKVKFDFSKPKTKR